MTSSSDKAAGRVLLPATINPTRYDLKFTPNFDTFTFSGQTTIEVTTTDDIATNEIIMHAKELCFASASYVVKGGDGEKKKDAEEICVNFKATTVTFVFGDKIPANSTLVSF